MASCLSKAIVQMKHKILTAHGETIIEMINTLERKLGGNGQSSAGSGDSWHCYTEPLLDAHNFPRISIHRCYEAN